MPEIDLGIQNITRYVEVNWKRNAVSFSITNAISYAAYGNTINFQLFTLGEILSLINVT